MYYIFFIHWSVDGHLGCFHILAAIVNSAAVKTVHLGVGVGELHIQHIQEWNFWVIW